ncbi:MAG: carbohydrate kinase family protein, partial [Minisyncoccia bacterium]
MTTTQLDFIAIGDTTVDEFIKLKEAHVYCDAGHEECEIAMKWGDKLPFEFSVLVPGVGNAANAAVAAARLELRSGFVSNIGKDRYGEEVLEAFKREGLDTTHVQINDGIPTNHHYVLWFQAERTILIKHEAYPYAMPENFSSPKWIYLSSIGDHSEKFHDDLAAWLGEHRETKLAFQPGTFQMEMGKDKLKEIYAASELVACNKEEAERILEIGETDIKELLKKMHGLGPKIVIITDGPNGSYASDGTHLFKTPMYPDPKPPLDRTGAGDACTSTIVAALALG